MVPLQLNLFESFSLLRGDGSEIILEGRRPIALITLIALSSGRTVTRDQAISRLWCKRSFDQAGASLRSLLSKIGASNQGELTQLIEKNRSQRTLHIPPEWVSVDTLHFHELAHSHTTERRLKVLEVYRGDLLENFNLNEPDFQNWLAAERSLLRELFRDTLLGILPEFQNMNAYAEISLISNRLLALENTDEIAHRALMSMYFQQGNKSAALKQFKQCEQAVRDLLDESPSRDTIELHQKICDTRGERPETHITHLPSPNLTKSLSQGISIGVAAFESKAEYSELVDSIAGDIVTALARFKWMVVVPRGTTFSFRDKAMNAVEIGQLLNVHYMVDGSAQRRSSKSHQMSVALNDVITQNHLWGSHYSLDDAMSEEAIESMIGKLVSELELRVRINEVRRVLIGDSETSNAFECVWKAISHMYELSEVSFEAAQIEFGKAEHFDDTYAPLYSWWALWQIFCVGQGWAKDPAVEAAKAYRLARKANRLDPEDSLALAIMGHCEAFLYHEFDEALRCFDRSLALNPHSAFAWMLSSATYTYYGQPEEALRRLAQSEQLCPIEPHFGFMQCTAQAIAHTFLRDYREGIRWGRRVVRESPFFTNGYKPLIACLGHAGKHSEAKEYTRRLLELEPEFSIELFCRTYPFNLEEDKEHYVAGLVAAGVPEFSAHSLSKLG